MRRRDKYKHLLNLFANGAMMAAEVAIYAVVWYQIYRPGMNEENQLWRRGNWAVIGMYALFLFFFMHVLGGFKIGYLRITDICLSQILAILFANVVEYFQVCLVANNYMPVWPMLALSAVQILIAIPCVYAVRYVYVQLYPPRRMIVVYGKYSPRDLVKKINSRRDKYDVCAMENVDEGLEKICERVMEYDAVVLCDLPTQIRNQILKFCYAQGKRTYITPKLSDIILMGTESIHLFDTPLRLARNQGLTIEQRFVKRAMDIAFSLIAAIVTAPLVIIIAAAIHFYDGGPVFYRQERLTRDRETFEIIKFRSMRVNSEADGARLAQKGDSRVTPIGRLLRQTHLDELPQLYNILRGEMSLVGPRPERREIAEKYEKEVPEFGYRLKVKAGLTGYAQVYGKYNTTPYDKLKLDLLYIENYSVWMDIKLVLMTTKVIFQRERTEGVDSGQRTAIKEK